MAGVPVASPACRLGAGRPRAAGAARANARQACHDVGERFSSCGRRLSDHYREAGGTGRETVEGSQRKLEEAAREIGNEIGRAFTALGETINDDDAKKELKRAVSAIGDAVTVTVSEAGRAVRGRGTSDGL